MRGPHRRNEPWEGRGDCIDCNNCVVVCPMGIDIRDGSQLECINCGLCIDACDEIMDKIGRTRGLIAYDTLANTERRALGENVRYTLLRARPLLYAGMIAVVGLIMLFGLTTRAALDLNVLRDRNPLYVELSDGSVRNGYTVKIINKQHEMRAFRLEVEGLARHSIDVVGMDFQGDPVLDVRADKLASYRVFVTAPREILKGSSTPIHFTVTDTLDGSTITYNSVFRAPEP